MKKDSFTIIEILSVVIIVSLLLIASLPQFRGSYRSLKFKSATNDIISLIRLAQSKALTEREKDFKIAVSPDENKMELLSFDSVEKTLRLPRGITIDSNIKEIVLDKISGETLILTPSDEWASSGNISVIDTTEDKEIQISVFTTGWVKIEGE